MSSVNASIHNNDSRPCRAPNDNTFTELVLGVQHFPIEYMLLMRNGSYYVIREKDIIYDSETLKVDEEEIRWRIIFMSVGVRI